MASQPIYQFYAELCYYEPKIWRRFQVLSGITMSRLAYIIMTLFEMDASHPFCFEVPVKQNYDEQSIGERPKFGCGKILRYEIITEGAMDFLLEGEESFNVFSSKLKNVVFSPKSLMNFNYDYGDDWNISIFLEKIIIDKDIQGNKLPRILDGNGYGIVENCGGVYGLNYIAEAFKMKEGEQYEVYCKLFKCIDFDLDKFDIDAMHTKLKEKPKKFAKRIEPQVKT